MDTNEFNSIVKSLDECSEEIGKVRHKFDVENLKQDYQAKTISSLRDITILVNQYDKRVGAAFDKIHTNFIEERPGFGEDFKEEVANSITELNTKEEYEQAIDIVTSIKDSILEKIDLRYSAFVNHIEKSEF